MVWGPTNLSPESCSISNYKRFGDCGLVSPPTDRRCNQIADNATCHSRHWSLIFIKRPSIIPCSDSGHYSRFASVGQSDMFYRHRMYFRNSNSCDSFQWQLNTSLFRKENTR